MDTCLQRKPDGKKFHAPLAACSAIDLDIGTWARVEVFRRGGRWGARLDEDSSTQIIIDYNREAFLNTLTEI
jgi:hypothetical protein